MNRFEKYFSLYETTDPPPIITDDYKKVYDSYSLYHNPVTDQEEPSQQKNSSLEMTPEPSKVKFEDISFYKPENLSQHESNNQAKDIIDLARQFVGTRYQWGGSTPSTGFDCSGLIQYVYKQSGIKLPRTVKEIEKVGKEVSLDNVKVGDLICTRSTGQSGRHIRLVSKIEDGQIYTIEAKGKKYGVIESPFNDYDRITTIRRINPSNDQNYIIQYFKNKGLTESQARGIYGNLMQESRGNIKAVSNDGNNSYGLAQWTGVRKDRLFNKYGTNPTMKQQLDFIWEELNTTHKEALRQLKDTTTIHDATRVFMNEFERPHKDYANFSKRLKYANSIA